MKKKEKWKKWKTGKLGKNENWKIGKLEKLENWKIGKLDDQKPRSANFFFPRHFRKNTFLGPTKNPGV